MRQDIQTYIFHYLLIAVPCLCIGLALALYGGAQDRTRIQRDTVTTVRVVHDTVSIHEPLMVYDSVIGVLRHRIALSEKAQKQRAQSLKYVQESEYDAKTLVDMASGSVTDSVDVPLPVRQRRYEDSTYTAWVSGPIDPKLDSIHVYRATRYITKEITAIEYSKRKRWSLGPQVTYGWNGRKWDVNVGIGVQYKILEF